MNMRWLALVLLALLAACSQAPSRHPGETTAGRSEETYRAQIHTELAAHYFTRGQYSVALTEAREAIAIEPGHAPAYNIFALIHARLHEDVQAEESFRKAIDLAPTYSEVRNNYGYFLCQRQRYDEALPLFEAALRNPLYASSEKPLGNAGLCALHKGDAVLARGYLQRALARARNQPTALLGMAELEMREHNAPAARSYLKPLLDLNDFKPQALWLAVRVERALGNRDAEAAYGALLRREHPEAPEARLLLDGLYEKMGTMP